MLRVARSIPIEHELSRRGVKLLGRVERVGPCPRCGGDDRFSINVKKQVFNCRQCGGKGGGSIDLVMFLDGCDFDRAVAHLAGERTDYSICKQHTSTTKKCEEKPPNGSALWRAAVYPRGTLVEQYLKSRALELPGEAANEAIRFHPDCPFMAKRYPAMICLVRNIVSNEPQAIHRTALAADGTALKRDGKTLRLSLGPIAGGAIKIDPDEDVTQGLCIGEGVETCLSGRQMGLRPVWAAVSTSGIAKFPVLGGVDGLRILKENDANGASARAVEECARRWYEAGRDVTITEPDVGSDLNDELRERVG